MHRVPFGVREQLLYDTFGVKITTTRYARLNELLDRPESLEYDAVTVNRLRRLRSARMNKPSSRRLGMVG